MTDSFAVGDVRTVVTGASSGIGQAIAERFASEGAPVAICSREQDNVDPVAEGIAADGGDAHAFECDVRDEEAVEGFLADAAEAMGGIDCLVNNAGAGFMANFEDISENGWETIVETNLSGTRHCCVAAVEELANGGGSIINLSTAGALQGFPYMSHYGASKAGVINLTGSLSYEWAEKGIRVNCIAPGFVATPGLASQMGITAEEIDRTEVDRSVGLPSEIADVAQFLASEAASFLTGETIVPRGKPDLMESPET